MPDIRDRAATIIARAQAFGGMESLSADDLAEVLVEELNLVEIEQLNARIKEMIRDHAKEVSHVVRMGW